MYGGMWFNGDSGSISGPQMLPVRSTTGWTPLPWRLCVVSGSTALRPSRPIPPPRVRPVIPAVGPHPQGRVRS